MIQRSSLWMILYFVMMGALLGAPVLVNAQSEGDTTDEVPSGLTIYVVQRGDTLFTIAQTYAVSMDDLATLNGLTDPTRIDVGQRLLVPDLSVTDPEPVIHVVQPGETLFTIATFYAVTMDDLVALNELANPDDIFAGQELVIVPAGGFETAPDITATAIPTQPIVSGDDSLPVIGTNIHIVQPGETLFRIATFYELTVQELSNANSITDATLIYSGQQLIIPNLDNAQVEIVDLPAPITELSVAPLLLVEGETGVIEISTEGNASISGTLLGRNLAFIGLDGNTRHVAFFGIPIFTETDVYTVNLSVTGADSSVTPFAFNVRVVSGFYGTQNINITNSELTSQAVQDNELSLLTNLTSAVTLNRPWTEPFSIPAAAAMNSPFGTNRSYNEGPISAYHSGADFATVPGTPIFAAASGIVVLVDELNIRGNAIVIDHGWGIYSAYAHLSGFEVALGEQVETGQIIGLAGATGRVSGPHLHWEVWVNGVAVNPITWTQVVFPS